MRAKSNKYLSVMIGRTTTTLASKNYLQNVRNTSALRLAQDFHQLENLLNMMINRKDDFHLDIVSASDKDCLRDDGK